MHKSSYEPRTLSISFNFIPRLAFARMHSLFASPLPNKLLSGVTVFSRSSCVGGTSVQFPRQKLTPPACRCEAATHLCTHSSNESKLTEREGAACSYAPVNDCSNSSVFHTYEDVPGLYLSCSTDSYEGYITEGHRRGLTIRATRK